jgi:hypothetical protein
VILDQVAFDDLDGARGHVVVVVPGLLLVRPAEQPHVHVQVSVELHRVPSVGLVEDVPLPELTM